MDELTQISLQLHSNLGIFLIHNDVLLMYTHWQDCIVSMKHIKLIYNIYILMKHIKLSSLIAVSQQLLLYQGSELSLIVSNTYGKFETFVMLKVT